MTEDTQYISSVLDQLAKDAIEGKKREIELIQDIISPEDLERKISWLSMYEDEITWIINQSKKRLCGK